VLDEVIAIRAHPSLLQGLQCKLVEPAWLSLMEDMKATVQPHTDRHNLANSKVKDATPCLHLGKDFIIQTESEHPDS